MILTRSHFRRFQEAFYRKLLNTPFTVELETVQIISTPTEDFSLADFVGDNPRIPSNHRFQALYEREIPKRVREKYGLPSEVNGVVYLSPLQLVPVLGTFKLDWNKTKVHFTEHTQVIEKIEYLEPLYESCIGIQLFLKDSLKGG